MFCNFFFSNNLPNKSWDVPGQEDLGPGTRQDLDTLKVPWYLKIGKVPGKMTTLLPSTLLMCFSYVEKTEVTLLDKIFLEFKTRESS